MKAILIAFLMLPLTAQSQTSTSFVKDAIIFIETTDTNVKATQTEIFQSAKLWIAKNFGSAKAVIDLEDLQAGTIVLKYQFDTKTIDTAKSGRQVILGFKNKATMQIDCRDHRIRIRASNFSRTFDLSAQGIDMPEKYLPLETDILSSIAKGHPLDELQNQIIYRSLFSDTKITEQALISFIKSAGQDRF